uniref:Uncharacterized protein n=1 Tax=Ditylenchus dipsaci TaxID=166011 RepID=A0A915DW41_9BILA
MLRPLSLHSPCLSFPLYVCAPSINNTLVDTTATNTTIAFTADAATQLETTFKPGSLVFKVDQQLKRVIGLEPDVKSAMTLMVKEACNQLWEKDGTGWESELQVSDSFDFLEVFTDSGLCVVKMSPM